MNHWQWIQLPSGVTLGVRDELNEEAVEGAPVLLCVHGFPFDYSMWNSQRAAALGASRLIAPNLRGFGSNQPIAPDDDELAVLTMQQCADDLNDLLDAMEISQPVYFCGLSMGGYIAWQFWLRHRQRLAGLVLCDTRAAADSDQARAGRRYLADRVLREGTRQMSQEMLQKVFARQHLERKADFVETSLTTMSRTAPMTVAAALRGMAKRPDMQAQLPSVTLPALVLCGAEDKLSPPEEMRAMAEAMPNATFCEIADAGHMSPLENPDAVNQAIASFLQER